MEVGGNYSITVNKDMTKSIIKQVLHLKKYDVNLGRSPILKSELSIFARAPYQAMVADGSCRNMQEVNN